MIEHIVLFKPREGLSTEQRESIVQALTTAAREIPSIRRLRVGRRVLHHLPGYEQAMREDYEYAVIVEVDDLESLKAYLQHPAHSAIGGHFTQSASAALAYDYEIAEPHNLLATD
jgi:hypothetical protein